MPIFQFGVGLDFYQSDRIGNRDIYNLVEIKKEYMYNLIWDIVPVESRVHMHRFFQTHNASNVSKVSRGIAKIADCDARYMSEYKKMKNDSLCPQTLGHKTDGECRNEVELQVLTFEDGHEEHSMPHFKMSWYAAIKQVIVGWSFHLLRRPDFYQSGRIRNRDSNHLKPVYFCGSQGSESV